MSKKKRDPSLPPPADPLPSPVTDAHTHLAMTAEFASVPVAELVESARRVGVCRIVDVGTEVADCRTAVAHASEFPAVIATVALHPNDAARAGAELDGYLAEIAQLAQCPQVRAIGETGLDFYRTKDPEGQETQYRVFAWHIELAKRLGLPLMIHERDAHYETLQVLDAEGAPAKVMMHCFSGDAAFARECAGRGYWLSFPGNITYPANEYLREALDTVPLGQLLVETDAPFLTPAPYRGRPNAAHLIPLTVRFIAQRRGLELGELCRILHNNATSYFGEW
ncbi:MAG: TatD family hydrolase [Propionibacteriaceae bacterium]|jgi:TatD DNase family protein|nr:TatD family hydrolase [Propionibacteriaceae bacterium]